MNDITAAAPSLEAGNGLPVATCETQLIMGKRNVEQSVSTFIPEHVF